MPRQWVVNASPLIVLGRLGQIEWLPRLAGNMVVPSGVAEEIAAGPPDDAARLWLEGDGACHVRTVAATDPVVSAWDLGLGETAVLSFAQQHPGYVAVLDDAAARHCAQALSLPIKGTLSVVVMAKRAGLIEKATPLFDRLIADGFRVKPSVLEEAKALAGESES